MEIFSFEWTQFVFENHKILFSFLISPHLKGISLRDWITKRSERIKSENWFSLKASWLSITFYKLWIWDRFDFCVHMLHQGKYFPHRSMTIRLFDESSDENNWWGKFCSVKLKNRMNLKDVTSNRTFPLWTSLNASHSVKWNRKVCACASSIIVRSRDGKKKCFWKRNRLTFLFTFSVLLQIISVSFRAILEPSGRTKAAAGRKVSL